MFIVQTSEWFEKSTTLFLPTTTDSFIQVLVKTLLKILFVLQKAS